MTDFDWTPERLERLRALWENGMSAKRIAEDMGPGLSKNAVIGKVHRMKLPSRPSPLKVQPLREHGGKGRFAKKIASACKWPVGDPKRPDFHFCGKEPVPGKPYCESHLGMAHSRAPEHNKVPETDDPGGD